MKTHSIAIVAACLLTVACGDSPTAPTPTGGNTHDTAQIVQTDFARFGVRNSDPCGDVTYVGPIRLPISVHGTTVNLSWLGNDGATRGYEVQFERYDVTNVWLPVASTVVTSPEIEYHFRTEGTYRVRVRGLFCNEQIGGFTDWQIFSTESTENHDAPPLICLTSVNGCYPPPPPCLVECPPPPCTHDCDEGDHDNGHGNDDDHHDEDNPGNGGGNPGDDGGPGPGGPPPCNLHTTANPHNGDHNDDGHNDCGHGH